MTVVSALTRRAIALVLGMAVLAAPLMSLPAPPASAAAFVPGQQTRFPLPDANAKPTSIVTGADGALWIAESNGHALVRMTTDGSTTRYPIPSGASPTAVAAGTDGTIWWVAAEDHAYGYLTPAGVLHEESSGATSPIAVAV
ncbi:MAG: hypothetical protein Q7T71_16350, partial [Herbiconiux sp.]|nr:hypothetical protein [Herbiconiux sp.]